MAAHDEHDLHGLLRHCRKQAERYELDAQTAPYQLHAQWHRAATKWRTWARLLAELIVGNGK